jgi:small subunit ribosomal protein S3
VLAERG